MKIVSKRSLCPLVQVYLSDAGDDLFLLTLVGGYWSFVSDARFRWTLSNQDRRGDEHGHDDSSESLKVKLGNGQEQDHLAAGER